MISVLPYLRLVPNFTHGPFSAPFAPSVFRSPWGVSIMYQFIPLFFPFLSVTLLPLLIGYQVVANSGGSSSETSENASAAPIPRTTMVPVTASDILAVPRSSGYTFTWIAVPSGSLSDAPPSKFAYIIDPLKDTKVAAFLAQWSFVRITSLSVDLLPQFAGKEAYTNLCAAWVRTTVSTVSSSQIGRVPGNISMTFGGPFIMAPLVLPCPLASFQDIAKSTLELSGTPKLALYFSTDATKGSAMPINLRFNMTVDFEGQDHSIISAEPAT